MKSRQSRHESRLIRWTIALYPRVFKERFGDDFAQALDDWMTDGNGGPFQETQTCLDAHTNRPARMVEAGGD